MQNYQNPPYPSTFRAGALPRGAALILAPGARVALGLILLLALALRLWGVAFGLPYVIQPDEPSVELRVLHMWLAGDPNPHYYVYPSLYYDVQALWALVVGHAVGLFQPDVLRHPYQHLPVYYLAGRVLTVLFGTITVYVVFLAGRIFSVRLGLIAAFFLAIAAQHIQQSHYITVDAPTALFTALAAFFALRLLRGGGMRGGGMRDVVLGGVAAGLAAGTKYNAGLALALPVVAALLSRQPWRWRLGACAAAAAVCAVTFIVTTPFALLDPPPFLNSLHVVARHYGSGHPGAEGNDNAIWYLLYLWNTGLQAPLTLLALLGVAAVVVRDRRAGLTLLAFAVPYYALLCSTFVRFDRNLLPLLPFLVLLAAATTETLIPPLALVLRNRTAALALLLGVSAAPSAYAASTADFALMHPFSEQIAAAWVNANLPAGATLATENWEGLSLDSPRFRITHVGWYAQHPYDWYKARGVRYVAVDSWTDGGFLNDPRRYPVETARYRELYRRARLLWRVTGDSLPRPGPTMSIYELR